MAKLADFEHRNMHRIGTKATTQRPTSKGGHILFELRHVTAEQLQQQQKPGTSGTMENNDQSSMTTRLLAETVAVDDTCSFVEFAKFEAIPNSPNSKRFAIVFPTANCVLPVHIVRLARIADLIGLACLIYTRQQREPPCEQPSQYDLFLAEEDSMDFDTELPPQDRRRLVADCGFPALAMVARGPGAGRSSKSGDTSGSRKASFADAGDSRRRHQANIFLTDGRCYVMQLDSLDVPLRQLFDYAMERKKADDQKLYQHNANLFLDAEYVLETYDKPGHALDLANSLCSIGTQDFVLLRVNSARGNHLLLMSPLLAQQNAIGGGAVGRPRPSLTQSRSMINIASSRNIGDCETGKNSSLNVDTSWSPLIMPTAECVSAAKIGQNHLQQQRQQQKAKNNAKASFNSMTATAISELRLAQFLHEQQCQKGPFGGSEKGNVSGQYAVNRVHRFQPKTPARLILREHCLELVPNANEQSQENGHHKKASPILKRVGQQTKRIPWELVAAAEVPPHSEQRSAARRTVRIIWLCCSLPLKIQKRLVHLRQQQLTAEYIFAIFDCCIWKTLLVETAGHEAWNIGVRLSELLDHRPSAVHALYQHSSGASIKPAIAAERAFGTKKQQKHHQQQQHQSPADDAQQHNPMIGPSSSSTAGGTSSSLLGLMPTSATAPQLFSSAAAGGGWVGFCPETLSTASSLSTHPPFSPTPTEDAADQLQKQFPDHQQKEHRKQQRNRLSAMLPFPLKWQQKASK